MNPSIWAGSKPPYGWATYSTGTPRSGKMSRDMRSSARNPSNAAATIIVKSEIGRRNANDTKFIVRFDSRAPFCFCGQAEQPPSRGRIGSFAKQQTIQSPGPRSAKHQRYKTREIEQVRLVARRPEMRARCIHGQQLD